MKIYTVHDNHEGRPERDQLIAAFKTFEDAKAYVQSDLESDVEAPISSIWDSSETEEPYYILVTEVL